MNLFKNNVTSIDDKQINSDQYDVNSDDKRTRKLKIAKENFLSELRGKMSSKDS